MGTEDFSRVSEGFLGHLGAGKGIGKPLYIWDGILVIVCYSRAFQCGSPEQTGIKDLQAVLI